MLVGVVFCSCFFVSSWRVIEGEVATPEKSIFNDLITSPLKENARIAKSMTTGIKNMV